MHPATKHLTNNRPGCHAHLCRRQCSDQCPDGERYRVRAGKCSSAPDTSRNIDQISK
jgi:hypothetical protein